MTNTTLSDEDRIKLIKFEIAEARWIHEEIIRPALYNWVDRIIINVVEHKKYGMAGRLFHFIVQYFYISKFLKIRIERSRHTSLVGGKGFRSTRYKIRLDAIGSKVFKQGQEIAYRKFPIGIIQ